MALPTELSDVRAEDHAEGTPDETSEKSLCSRYSKIGLRSPSEAHLLNGVAHWSASETRRMCGRIMQWSDCQQCDKRSCTTFFQSASGEAGEACREGRRRLEIVRWCGTGGTMAARFLCRESPENWRRQSLHLYCCFPPFRPFLTTLEDPQKKVTWTFWKGKIQTRSESFQQAWRSA